MTCYQSLMYRIIIIIVGIGMVSGADDALAEAHRAYVDGLAAYDQGLVEDVSDNEERVRYYLLQARRSFKRAEQLVEAQRSGDRDVDLLLADIRRAGKPCCGRTSLWDKYPLPAIDK